VIWSIVFRVVVAIVFVPCGLQYYGDGSSDITPIIIGAVVGIGGEVFTETLFRGILFKLGLLGID